MNVIRTQADNDLLINAAESQAAGDRIMVPTSNAAAASEAIDPVSAANDLLTSTTTVAAGLDDDDLCFVSQTAQMSDNVSDIALASRSIDNTHGADVSDRDTFHTATDDSDDDFDCAGAANGSILGVQTVRESISDPLHWVIGAWPSSELSIPSESSTIDTMMDGALELQDLAGSSTHITDASERLE